jgi:hypothetical protein
MKIQILREFHLLRTKKVSVNFTWYSTLIFVIESNTATCVYLRFDHFQEFLS